MITLKAALVAASAIGTVAVGGGATWAMTGAHQAADLRSGQSRTTAVRHVRDRPAPGTAPACLPPEPGRPGAKLSAGGPPHAEPPEAKLPEAKRPEAKVPEAKRPEVEVPHGRPPANAVPRLDVPPAGKPVPADKPVPVAKPKPPTDLPPCTPNVTLPGKDAQVAAPAPRVPAEPGLSGKPGVPALDCGKLPPAVRIGGTAEKTVILPRGLRHASTVHGDATLRARRICAVTQKWTGAAGAWLTVANLRTPAHMTGTELRRVLGLEHGTAVTIAGAAGWQGANGGVLVSGADGSALYVDGGTGVAGGKGVKGVTGGLRAVAAALRQAQ